MKPYFWFYTKEEKNYHYILMEKFRKLFIYLEVFDWNKKKWEDKPWKIVKRVEQKYFVYNNTKIPLHILTVPFVSMTDVVWLQYWFIRDVFILWWKYGHLLDEYITQIDNIEQFLNSFFSYIQDWQKENVHNMMDPLCLNKKIDPKRPHKKKEE